MTQHNEYSSIPQTVRDIVANRCSLLDEYIVMQTGDNRYGALIHNLVTNEVTELTFSRVSNYGQYNVAESEGTWEFTVNNEYYVYSNCKIGSALDLPVYDGVIAFGTVTLVIVLMFLVVFKGWLFPFFRRK